MTIKSHSSEREFNSQYTEKNIVDFIGRQRKFFTKNLYFAGLEITLAIQFVVKGLLGDS